MRPEAKRKARCSCRMQNSRIRPSGIKAPEREGLNARLSAMIWGSCRGAACALMAEHHRCIIAAQRSRHVPCAIIAASSPAAAALPSPFMACQTAEFRARSTASAPSDLLRWPFHQRDYLRRRPSAQASHPKSCPAPRGYRRRKTAEIRTIPAACPQLFQLRCAVLENEESVTTPYISTFTASIT